MSNLLKEVEQLINPTPAPDEDYDDGDVTAAKLVDKSGLLDDDNDSERRIGTSRGRILAEDDERYEGIVVSRSMIDYDDDQVESSGEMDINDEEESTGGEKEQLEEETGEDQEGEDQSIGSEGYSSEDGEDSTGGLVQLFSKVDTADEKTRGRAVRAQLRLWEQLLGARIRFQRILSLANQLPQTAGHWQRVWSEVEEKTGNGEDERACYEECRRVMGSAVKDLIKVQDELLKRNNVAKEGSKKRNEDDDEEIPSSDEEEKDEAPKEPSRKRPFNNAEDYSTVLTERNSAMKPFRDETIVKWFEKTRLASGRLTKSSFSAFEKNALQQIEQIVSDRDRLIKRTQLKRSNYSVIGKPKIDNEDRDEQEYDEEIFDDDDFYQQLLRELIERRTAGVTDPVLLSRQWLEMQTLKNKSKKKKVDRRASKGRRCRYDVVPKLVNFMAPVDRCPISDQARDELFSSLFKCAS